jgi:hypothetical protein
VINLLKEGTAESAILAKVRLDGIDARPSTAEILELRMAGATDGFIARLMAAPTPDLSECPPQPTIEFQFYYLPPLPFPGLLPVPWGLWWERPWIWPGPLEP